VFLGKIASWLSGVYAVPISGNESIIGVWFTVKTILPSSQLRVARCSYLLLLLGSAVTLRGNRWSPSGRRRLRMMAGRLRLCNMLHGSGNLTLG
jgi:hypothetical protein